MLLLWRILAAFVMRVSSIDFILAAFVAVAATSAADSFRWKKLDPIPDRLGFAGPFAGASHEALIVAGGANFPGAAPWEGGAKKFHDTIFVLENPTGKWRAESKLPRPMAYGVSLTHPDGILCVGGADSERHYADVFSIAWKNERIGFEKWPSLPRPTANLCGAIVSNAAYMAGGIEFPNATNALRTFWSLDLKSSDKHWREIEPWPGPGRMLAVAGTQDGLFFLFGGASLKAGPDGKPVREWLRDAYCFAPGKGWRRIADLPKAIAAAPSSAIAHGEQLLILGGDDGTQVGGSPAEHRGFSRTILAYDIEADQWSELGELPFAFVTTPVVTWNGRYVIPGGEIRPGVRSTEVWAGSLP